MAAQAHSQGFTLVELLVTIVMVSIFSSAAIITYRDQTKKPMPLNVKPNSAQHLEN